MVDDIKTTLAKRGKKYGKFNSQAECAQELKGIMQMHRPDGVVDFTWLVLSATQQEALDMIASKIARILNGDPGHIDSWHDIAGYATLVVNELSKERDAK